MTLRRLSNPDSSIRTVLDAADDKGGILLEHEGRQTYALIPLDEDLLDYLLEHNPKLIRESARIRRRMKRGVFHTHEQVKRMLKGRS
jgi:hypothetical protein